MNKLFRPKCLRRVLLCLALLFPIVYLCGGLFFALAGAHGENVLATEENSVVDRKNIDFNQRVNIPQNVLYTVVNTYTISISNTYGTTLYFQFPFDLVYTHKYLFRIKSSMESFRTTAHGIFPYLNNTSTYNGFTGIYTNEYGSNRLTIVNETVQQGDSTIEINLIDLTQAYGAGNEPSIEQYNIDFPNVFYDYTLSEFVSLPVYGIPSEQNSIFYHVFGQRNFISQLGKDLVDGSTKGFNPMNELFRTINENIMHFEDTDGLAMFGLGYVYYAVNVLIVYEVLILAVKLIMLPLRAVELFDKKEDI